MKVNGLNVALKAVIFKTKFYNKVVNNFTMNILERCSV